MHVICFVDPEDPAIAVLVEHFRNVVGAIVDDRWRHFASRWVSEESKKKVSVMGLQELNKALELNRQPSLSFLVAIGSDTNCKIFVRKSLCP